MYNYGNEIFLIKKKSAPGIPSGIPEFRRPPVEVS